LEINDAIELPDTNLFSRLTREIVADVGMFFYCRSNFHEKTGWDDWLTFVIRRRAEENRPDHDTSRYLRHLMKSALFQDAEEPNLSISQSRQRAMMFLENKANLLIDHLIALTPQPKPVSPITFIKLLQNHRDLCHNAVIK
jgi:hypothetical protein